MKKILLVLATLFAGFAGGLVGSSLLPAHAQGTGYSPTRIFLNGQEVKPSADNKININIPQGALGTWNLVTFTSDGQITLFLSPPIQNTGATGEAK